MWTASNSTKCCATCAHWGGKRDNSRKICVETNTPSDRGKCYAGVFCSVTDGPSACQQACNKYQKWSALR